MSWNPPGPHTIGQTGILEVETGRRVIAEADGRYRTDWTSINALSQTSSLHADNAHKLKVGDTLVQSGTVQVACLGKSGPGVTNLTFPEAFADVPNIQLTQYSSVPSVQWVDGCAYGDVSATGITGLKAWRADDVASGNVLVQWMAIGKAL